MSSFFNKLKNSVQKAVGLKQAVKGHKLGDGSEDPDSLDPLVDAVSLDSIYGNTIYDITFTTEVLGIGVTPDKDGLPRVAMINNTKLTQDHSLRVNDLIIAVDNNDVLSFDSFMETICVIGRPVTIR
jgi:C-terminal processing protease CtpA/Prc